MNHRPVRLFAVLLLSCATWLSTSAAQAGPTARELAARGDNVGIPKPRPTRRQDDAQPRQSLANPLDSDSQDSNSRDTDPAPRRDPSKQRFVEEETSDEVPTAPVPAGESACFKALAEIASIRAVATPATDDPACVIEDPVNLTATLSPFPVSFPQNLTLDCPFALTLTKFVDGTAQALARHHLGTAIQRVHSGEGFVCRRRNNALTGKLSEHAFGNATDWIGFTFESGGKLLIQDTAKLDADEAGFLDALRAAACGAFTTVLGPGSNPAHATHFHFDLGRSKGKKNPYRICE